MKSPLGQVVRPDLRKPVFDRITVSPKVHFGKPCIHACLRYAIALVAAEDIHLPKFGFSMKFLIAKGICGD